MFVDFLGILTPRLKPFSYHIGGSKMSTSRNCSSDQYWFRRVGQSNPRLWITEDSKIKVTKDTFLVCMRHKEFTDKRRFVTLSTILLLFILAGVKMGEYSSVNSGHFLDLCFVRELILNIKGLMLTTLFLASIPVNTPLPPDLLL